MSIVERLPSYGVHVYDVQDKQDVPWLLGLSSKGIFKYEHADRSRPREVSREIWRDLLIDFVDSQIFYWKQLENLYYRDRRFSIEVHDPRR